MKSSVYQKIKEIAHRNESAYIKMSNLTIMEI